MWVISVCFGSILVLFYHPNSLQWIEIHHDQGFICGSITVTFYVPTIGIVCGNCTSSFGAMMSQFIRKLKDSTKSNKWYFCSLRKAQQREKERTQEFFSEKPAEFTDQVCQTTIQHLGYFHHNKYRPNKGKENQSNAVLFGLFCSFKWFNKSRKERNSPKHM